MGEISEAITIEALASYGLPIPKFAIGQVVYWAASERVEEAAGCPDCLDTRKWKVTLPSGLEFDVECDRCQVYSPHIPAYKTTRYVAVVNPLVIADITVATHARYTSADGPEISYSHRGASGSWIDEKRLFADESECLAKAEEMAAEAGARMLANDASVQKRHRLNAYGLAKVFAADEVEKRREAELKYEKAIGEICEVKELPFLIDGLGRHTKDIDAAAEAVARHLLNELNEGIPEEWGEI